jgi:hypothetical protein
MAGTFTALLFGSALADGDRSTEIAIAAITACFIETPSDMLEIINPKPVKTLKLFPFDGARWLACYI